MIYVNRKPLRGHATEFHSLDNDIRWLNYQLSRMIIRDDNNAVKNIREQIAYKMQQIERISK